MEVLKLIAKNRLALAERELGRSVVAINYDWNTERISKGQGALFFGVKDTNQIPNYVLDKLDSDQNMIWLTVDKAASKGRAIDTDLHNPITYRLMTGSSSGGPINILKGINDFAIGTDGGGSTLGPAMSCQLPSVIGSGIGLHVKQKKTSTDGIDFTGSVGVIAKDMWTLASIIETLINEELELVEEPKLKIAIPKKGTITCPDQMDMHEKVIYYLSKMDCSHISFLEVDMTGIDNRARGINIIQEILGENEADLILTCEGPIDVYGYGETIPQQFGQVGQELTKHHGKYLLRSANMCNTTAITVPTENLATGLVIVAKEGVGNCKNAFNLAKKLEKGINLPDVWKRYFLDNEQEFNGFQL